MENSAFKNQVVNMVDGQRLAINGIKDILGFNDGEILLECEGGRISVEGDNLKIESLSKEGGEILITGEILGIYRTPEDKKKRGLFQR